jgi:hypothetical protein
MANRKFSDPGRVSQPVLESAEAWRVKLKDNKPLVIKAGHQFEAIEKYKFACGIIATDRQFDVEPVTDEAEVAEAKDLPTRPSTAPVLTGFTAAERNGKEPETNLGVFGV